MTLNAAARPWVSIAFKCMAVLALIFAFIFFMRMQDEQSVVARYQKEGVVSRALVTGKHLDKMVHENGSPSGKLRTGTGRTTTTALQVLHVRFVPKSTVKYAEYPTKVSEADLPMAPPLTGNIMTDSEFGEVMFVPRALYDSTNVGDMFVVVDTRFSGDGPRAISDIADFDERAFYGPIAVALVLALLLLLAAIRIAKVPPASDRPDTRLKRS